MYIKKLSIFCLWRTTTTHLNQAMKRKSINLALLLDGPPKKITKLPLKSSSDSLLQNSDKICATQQLQNARETRPNVVAPVVNLALLLDKPRKETTRAAAVTTTEAAAAATADLPQFTPQGLPILANMPRCFDSEQQVHCWCDIPECLKHVEPTTLLKRNGGQMFPGITFLEGPHEYWLSEQVYIQLCNAQNKSAESSNVGKWNFHRFSGSVTKVAGRCFSPFDKDKAISSVLASRNYNSPDYEYYQMSAPQISNQWLAANLLGTMLHFFIELDCNEMTHLIPECLKEQTWRQYLQFKTEFVKNQYYPYLTELRVYDLEYDLAGSIDAVFVRRAELEAALKQKRLPKIVLVDWKRTSSLSKKSFTGETAAPPLQMFPDSNFYKYSMQLNIYRRLIEKNTGYRVEAMYLCRFHPRLGEGGYDLQPVETYTTQVDELLAVRKAELQIAAQQQQQQRRQQTNK